MIPILYEEPHFLLVNKPAAMFSQAAESIDSLQSLLVAQLKQRDHHPGAPFVGLPHRLDHGTSGIMLIARNQRALRRFGEQFQSRKVIKHYLAVVEGEFPPGEQLWDDFLCKIVDQPQAAVVAADTPGAKRALATARCLEMQAGQSLLRVRLETGRMHQIRAQSSSRGFPVVGDWLYGARTILLHDLPDTQASQTHPPLALHALSLEFRHPQTARSMLCHAPIPEYWRQLPERIWNCALQQAMPAESPKLGD